MHHTKWQKALEYNRMAQKGGTLVLFVGEAVEQYWQVKSKAVCQ